MRNNFSTQDLNEIFGVDIQISLEMTQNINLWLDMYKGNPPWIKVDKDAAKRQVLTNIPSLLAWDLAKKSVSEFSITATKENLEEDEVVGKFIEDAVAPFIRREIEYTIATGGVLVRPYWDIKEKTIKSDWYTADRIFPISWNGNVLTGVILMDIISKKIHNEMVTYTKLEAHIPFCKHVQDGVAKGYKVYNKAFRKKGYISPNAIGITELGESVPLAVIDAWAHISPETTIENCKSPLFAYMAMSCANNIDLGSPLGVAIFKDAVDQIRELDDCYSSFSWEMRSGEAKVFISDSIIPRELKGNELVESVNPIDRAWYKKLDTTQGELIKEYAPTLRVDSYVNSIRQNLAMICLLCHLDPSSFIWDANTGAITATEIISKNQATYETIVDIQEKTVRPAIETFIEASRAIVDLYADDDTLMPSDVTYTISFGDSILTDEESQKKTAMAECASGLRSKMSYLLDYRGLSEEQAQKELELMKNEAPQIDSFGGF